MTQLVLSIKTTKQSEYSQTLTNTEIIKHIYGVTRILKLGQVLYNLILWIPYSMRMFISKLKAKCVLLVSCTGTVDFFARQFIY